MNFTTIIMGVIALLLALLGIERNKSKKKDTVIEKQKAEIAKEKVQSKVFEEAIQVTEEVTQVKEEVLQEQKVEEAKIEEAETEKDVINLANSIINNFNRVPDGSR